MYYYVFESAKSANDKKIQERIKRIILSLGITGEQVSPNPARTIDELIDIGITKGYSTIVAVGNDIFANKIASSILNQKKPESKVVFGFIPKNPNESILGQTLGLHSIEQAIQALRFRHLKTLSIAVVIPDKFFLIPITMSSDKPFHTLIQLPTLEASAQVTNLSISPEIIVRWQDTSEPGGGFKKFIQKIFNQTKTITSKSQLHTQILNLKTDPSLPVYLDNEIIAKTPIRVKALPNYLHVIVNRDSISHIGKETPTLETTHK